MKNWRSIALMSALFSGCTQEALDDRSAQILHFIQSDNWIWLSRDTDQLEQKFKVMSVDPYNFMRGTVGLYYADIERVTSDTTSTRFLRESGTTDTLLVVDPHPENWGTCMPRRLQEAPTASWSDDLTLEWVDLDGSTYGPYILDLRRAALGILALSIRFEGCEVDCRASAVTALTEGYLAKLEDLELDKDSPPPRPYGKAISDLLETARDKGVERDRLMDATMELEDGSLGLQLKSLDTNILRGLYEMTPYETRRVDALVHQLQEHHSNRLRYLGGGRQYGRGVSSLSAERYTIHMDYGNDSHDDDFLLNIREVIDPPVVPGRLESPYNPFASNAQRIETVSRQIWSRADADPMNQGIEVGNMSFKVQTRSGWFEELDHNDINKLWRDGELVQDDYDRTAWVLGWTLAGSHGRAPGAKQVKVLNAILADVSGRESELIEETIASGERDYQAFLRDHLLFIDLLENWGPLLGLEVWL